MRLSCDRKPLLDAWKIVAPVVPARTTMAVLKNVRMECTADGVWLTATDNEIQARAKVDVQPQQPGEVLLPAAEFGGMLTESTGETISIELGQMVEVKSGRAKWRLPKQDAAAFPAVLPQENPETCTVSAESLSLAIQRTIYAIEDSSTTYALGGCLFDFVEAGKLVLATTGGKMLVTMPIGVNGAVNKLPIVPAKVLGIVGKSLVSGTVTIGLTESSISFQAEKAVIQSRLIDGRFPKWRESLAYADNAQKTELPAGLLERSVRQAMLTAETLANSSKGIDLEFIDGTLRISSVSTGGDSAVEMPAALDGSPLKMRLAAAYLRQFLSKCDSDGTVNVKVNERMMVLSDGIATAAIAAFH